MDMRKFTSMDPQACRGFKSFNKRVKSSFRKIIIKKVAVVKTVKNKRADKNLKKGIIKVRRHLFVAMEVVKQKVTEKIQNLKENKEARRKPRLLIV